MNVKIISLVCYWCCVIMLTRIPLLRISDTCANRVGTSRSNSQEAEYITGPVRQLRSLHVYHPFPPYSSLDFYIWIISQASGHDYPARSLRTGRMSVIQYRGVATGGPGGHVPPTNSRCPQVPPTKIMHIFAYVSWLYLKICLFDCFMPLTCK